MMRKYVVTGKRTGAAVLGCDSDKQDKKLHSLLLGKSLQVDQYKKQCQRVETPPPPPAPLTHQARCLGNASAISYQPSATNYLHQQETQKTYVSVQNVPAYFKTCQHKQHDQHKWLKWHKRHKQHKFKRCQHKRHNKTRNDTNNTHGTNQECADTNSINITQGTYGTNNAKLTDNGLFSILQFRNSLRAFYVLAKDTQVGASQHLSQIKKPAFHGH